MLYLLVVDRLEFMDWINKVYSMCGLEFLYFPATIFLLQCLMRKLGHFPPMTSEPQELLLSSTGGIAAAMVHLLQQEKNGKDKEIEKYKKYLNKAKKIIENIGENKTQKDDSLEVCTRSLSVCVCVCVWVCVCVCGCVCLCDFVLLLADLY